MQYPARSRGEHKACDQHDVGNDSRSGACNDVAQAQQAKPDARQEHEQGPTSGLPGFTEIQLNHRTDGVTRCAIDQP